MNVSNKILNITPYQPGKPIEEVKRELGLKEVIKLASNENPLGPSPKALLAIKKAAGNINRYPEGTCFYLRQALSERLGVSEENLIFGNGSDEIIDIIVKAFSDTDDEVLTADITFLEYKIISEQNGRKVVTTPLKNFKYDLSAIRANISSRTKIIFIANPNNPTGTYINNRELKDFLDSLPKNIIVVLDEAYFEFADLKDFPASLGYVKKNKNIMVLRTFSKAYGLAGLRIGYCIAQNEPIQYMERVRQPFNVNYLAQVGAQAALGDRDFLKKTLITVKEGKRYLYGELDKLGITFFETAANFIFIDLRQDACNIFKMMLKQGVIARELKQYGLNNFMRVTIGTKKENERFIKELKEAQNSKRKAQN